LGIERSKQIGPGCEAGADESDSVVLPGTGAFSAESHHEIEE
jgi:hypothetical protein